MIVELAILTGLAVGFSGPDGRAWLARRREARDRPRATVAYLPSAACRGTPLPSAACRGTPLDASGVPGANLVLWHESSDSTSEP